jgi:hypothetical protein
MNKIMTACAMGLLLSSCAWVKLTSEGEKTRVLSASEVGSCKRLGITTVSITDKVGLLEVQPEKIKSELEILARNAAADLKGDTVVAQGGPVEGKQDFTVYRCVNP